MDKKTILLLAVLFIFCCGVGFVTGIGLESLVKTINVAIEPGIGSIVYVHPELPEVQNALMVFLGKRLYKPWEPAVIVASYDDGTIRVRFCSDGYEDTYSRRWFTSYRLTNKLTSFAFCDN